MTEKNTLEVPLDLKAPGDIPVLHHVGFVVAAIAEVCPGFAASVGAQWDGEIIHDPRQGARVAFLRWPAPQSSALELVQPDGPESPLHKFLAKGGGLHHVCYEVDSLEEQLKQSRAAGCLLAKAPLPAVAFGGRMIAWVYTPQKLLVEYLER
jgi:methylmalonyl-CoA/ethylmalonyl-CoA epimerase